MIENDSEKFFFCTLGGLSQLFHSFIYLLSRQTSSLSRSPPAFLILLSLSILDRSSARGETWMSEIAKSEAQVSKNVEWQWKEIAVLQVYDSSPTRGDATPLSKWII